MEENNIFKYLKQFRISC